MFSGLFSDPTAQNLHPVSSAFSASELVAPLEKADLEWTCAGGFAAETQTFYNILDDGRFLMGQVIYSSTGLWYPTIQFTFKLYDPSTKEFVWRSLTAKDFVSPPPGQDKRSCKSDLFSVVHRDTSTDPDHSENYTINVQLGTDLQLSLNVFRPNSVPGVKVGKSPHGGYSYFGTNKDKADGYVVHRFWPRTKVTGHLMWGGGGSAAGSGGARMEEIKGTGMMVHAIQGMRPNLIARNWNFCWFTGTLPAGDGHEAQGVSGIMMEFTTPDNYGRKRGGDGGVTVNVGNVTIGDHVVVTAETKWPDEQSSSSAAVMSRATHLDKLYDKDTGYDAPQKIQYSWQGPVAHSQESLKAELLVDVGAGEQSKGLIEKVDFLAELPKVLKALVNATGTKPFIYQWMQHDVTLRVHGPSSVLQGKQEAEIKGTIFLEASYLS